MQLLPNDAPSPLDLPAGESLIKALYGQANELPASLFDLGISPFINAQILMFVLLIIPEQLLPQTQWMTKLRQARKEGKSVSGAAAGSWPAGRYDVCCCVTAECCCAPETVANLHLVGIAWARCESVKRCCPAVQQYTMMMMMRPQAAARGLLRALRAAAWLRRERPSSHLTSTWAQASSPCTW
jgi:hypothetical protein